MDKVQVQPPSELLAHDDGSSSTQGGDAETDVEVLKSVPQGFSIDCEEHANWLVRRITSARQYAEHVKEWAEREVRRAGREEQTLMFLFGRQIEQWVRSEIDKLKGKRKSLALPAGMLGFRTVASKLTIDDEQAVLVWAKQNLPSAVITVEKLSKSEINKYTEQTGVIPDEGVHIEPECERFFIR